MTTPLQKLPFAPLQEIVRARCVLRHKGEPGSSFSDGLTSLWREKSWQHQAYLRAQEAGELSLWAADRLAIDLGLHPGLIWWQWWEIEDQPTSGIRRAS